MGCIHGKEQDNITELYEPRDPWWSMIKNADLSHTYVRELDERITIMERSNKLTEKQRIRKQEERNRKQEQRNREQEESNRNQQKMNMEQQHRNKEQEERNRHQEEKNKEQEQHIMEQKQFIWNHCAKNQDKNPIIQKEEGDGKGMIHDSEYD